jgi:hypothetical protein
MSLPKQKMQLLLDSLQKGVRLSAEAPHARVSVLRGERRA